MAAQASAEDARLDGWVPSLDHATFQDWNLVYEPSEDTFLLLDALFADRAALRTSRVIVEIGPGSGVVSTYLAKLTSNKVLAVDVNAAACDLTKRTAEANEQRVDVMRGDLCGALRSRSVDALVFNPPYVPTADEEVGGGGIEASWAGGLRGRRVLDRLLPHVARVLAPAGRFYVVCVAENDPASIVSYLRERGLNGETVLRRRARNEALSVLRFVRSS
jgi:release factor glutamine methyltransferase